MGPVRDIPRVCASDDFTSSSWQAISWTDHESLTRIYIRTGTAKSSEKTPSIYRIQLKPRSSWWRHQMETFSALRAICAGNSSASGEFPAQRPVTRGFDVFFDLCLNKRLRKPSWGWWFEMLSRPLWHHCDAGKTYVVYFIDRVYLNQHKIKDMNNQSHPDKIMK